MQEILLKDYFRATIHNQNIELIYYSNHSSVIDFQILMLCLLLSFTLS